MPSTEEEKRLSKEIELSELERGDADDRSGAAALLAEPVAPPKKGLHPAFYIAYVTTSTTKIRRESPLLTSN